MDPAIHAVLRLLLAAILVLSVVGKLRGYNRFREIVGQYKVVAPSLTGTASVAVVLWEAVAVIGLWIWPRVGAALAAALFGIYALVIVANLLRGRAHIDCGCHWGGHERTAPLTPWLPVRNGGLVLVALLLYGPVVQRPLALVDGALIGVAAAFSLAAFFVMDRAVTQSLALARVFAAARRMADV